MGRSGRHAAGALRATEGADERCAIWSEGGCVPSRAGRVGKGGREDEEALVAGVEVVISQVQCAGKVQVGPDWVGTGDTLPPCLDMAYPSQNPSPTPPGCVGLLWGHTVPRFLPSCPVSLVTRLPPPLA